MAIDRTQHDLKNALLFLETFPEILRQHLPSPAVGKDPADQQELQELLELYRAKLQIIKSNLRS